MTSINQGSMTSINSQEAMLNYLSIVRDFLFIKQTRTRQAAFESSTINCNEWQRIGNRAIDDVIQSPSVHVQHPLHSPPPPILLSSMAIIPIPIPSPLAILYPSLSSPITTPISQAVTAPAYIEPHPITRPPLYRSAAPEDVEGEARYPILEAAYRPVKLWSRIRGVCPIPTHFRSPEDKSEMNTHITTQSICLILPRTSSRISLAKALTAQRIPSFTSSSSERGRRHHAHVLMVKIRGW